MVDWYIKGQVASISSKIATNFFSDYWRSMVMVMLDGAPSNHSGALSSGLLPNPLPPCPSPPIPSHRGKNKEERSTKNKNNKNMTKKIYNICTSKLSLPQEFHLIDEVKFGLMKNSIECYFGGSLPPTFPFPSNSTGTKKEGKLTISNICIHASRYMSKWLAARIYP